MNLERPAIDVDRVGELVTGCVYDVDLVLDRVDHKAPAAILREAHRPEARLDRDAPDDFQALGIDYGDLTGLAIRDVNEFTQGGVRDRDRHPAGLDVRDFLQARDVDHSHGSGIAIRDESTAAVAAKRELVVAFAGGYRGGNVARGCVEYGHAANFIPLGIVTDPDVFLVGLQGNTRRHLTRRDVAHYLEGFEIDHGDFAGARHCDEHRLLVAGLGPVGTRPLELDVGEQARDTGDADDRVDHGDARVAVHDHDVVAVHVDHRPHADETLQVLGDAGAAVETDAALLAVRGLDHIDPDAGIDAAQGLVILGARDTEFNVGETALEQLRKACRWRRLEVDLDTFADDLLVINIGCRIGCRGARAGRDRKATQND